MELQMCSCLVYTSMLYSQGCTAATKAGKFPKTLSIEAALEQWSLYNKEKLHQDLIQISSFIWFNIGLD